MPGHGLMPLPVKTAARRAAFYAVQQIGEEIWLVRRSPQGVIAVSTYVDEDIAELAAAHLNSLVRWEVPQQWAPTP